MICNASINIMLLYYVINNYNNYFNINNININNTITINSCCVQGLFTQLCNINTGERNLVVLFFTG